MPFHLPALTRRAFLHGSISGAAAVLLTRRLRSAEEAPSDPNAWALLSDTHIAADRTKIVRDINLTRQLTATVADVLAWERRPAGGLINGDLAFNTGESADYTTFADLVKPLRAAGIPLHLGMGNHDHRARFRAALQVDAGGPPLVEGRQISIVTSARANWFMLDSLDRTNVTPGVLGAAQLAWLERALDARQDKPALVVVHHNPNDGGNKSGLTETGPLLDLLRSRRHVQAHFFGHSHRWSVERDPSGLHLINLPTTAYPFDNQQPAGWVRAILEPEGMRLELRALDQRHPAHGQTHALAWRA